MASSDKPRIAVLEFKNKADNSYFVDDGDLDLMLGNSGPENSGGQTGSSGDLSVVGEVSVNGAISASCCTGSCGRSWRDRRKKRSRTKPGTYLAPRCLDRRPLHGKS